MNKPCWYVALLARNAFLALPPVPASEHHQKLGFSTHQKTDLWKYAAPKALSPTFTDVIQEILGTSKCRMSWNLVLESLSQPVINRYVIVFLALLGPESCAQGFASTLGTK